jgi:hypothetical protein
MTFFKYSFPKQPDKTHVGRHTFRVKHLGKGKFEVEFVHFNGDVSELGTMNLRKNDVLEVHGNVDMEIG